MVKIEVKNLSKTYPINGGRQWFRTFLSNQIQRKNIRLHALRDVSFTIRDGESYAVIGRNGAGKSTLLNVLAGLLEPDKGSVDVQGRIVSLLELGAGFHPDLTGRENMRINAALLGLSSREISDRQESIIEFAGLRDFMDQTVRTYSTGMAMRLAFSTAVHVDPEIVLIDEVLAVGDIAFQHQCLRRIKEMQQQGRIFICASHVAESLVDICQNAIWLEQGSLVANGGLMEVAEEYRRRYEYTTEISIPEAHTAG